MTYYHNGTLKRPDYSFRIGHAIRRLRAEGYTIRDIGGMLGMAENAVRAALPSISHSAVSEPPAPRGNDRRNEN